MSVTIDRTTTHERVPPPPARLSLTPVGPVPGLLDGAWWPRSRDLLRELPALADVLDARWGRITRVSVNPAQWPVIPRKVPAAGHTMDVGWFTDEQDPHKLILLSYTAGRWDLLVIPPETGAAAASRLMAAAATPGSLLTASRLMADETAARDAREDFSQEERWETDGGPAPLQGR
ncbi:DUF5994 family protein [Streptomyces rapamycinicus]|uniref:Uncharacterized protein n=2 Tax=Streptomyces rapamycinicus TaxID=1226757 RepID=A0A0A0NFN0_STRRN|nr:DUF5994 family protein [Streptomyces rapamycinicus]AGP53230.1 hypothetical protein M271_08050 [Streptomyces rapamycinicus NRRL 5491]MBB4780716.1 hypothetical protein [Streptomyces rapamycinicus]RLV74635.1 hypothetical protein D3C57_135455 [Streptomyces rapamycinicus NRRL 5491]UTO61418.1 DUF5994 family protein [Streptomyces rapamycinicus]UTP29365.1 DUF5994 family protein [Streptomyces rapamycinicus NRRL 5491]